MTAYLSLNLNVISLSACQNWKILLLSAPNLLTTQLATVMDTLQFVQPKRCSFSPRRRMDAPLTLRTRYLIFNADEMISSFLQKEQSDSYSVDLSTPSGSTFREMWYLIRALPGVEEVSLWTKNPSHIGQVLLNLQSLVITKGRAEDVLRNNGGNMLAFPAGAVDEELRSFEVGAVDKESRSFGVVFDGGPRKVAFKMV
jgi:hypothetical protein